jgi:hypothetical protein
MIEEEERRKREEVERRWEREERNQETVNGGGDENEKEQAEKENAEVPLKGASTSVEEKKDEEATVNGVTGSESEERHTNHGEGSKSHTNGNRKSDVNDSGSETFEPALEVLIERVSIRSPFEGEAESES